MIWSTTVYPQTPAVGVGTAFLVIAFGQALASPLLGLIAGAFGEAAPFAAALAIGAGAVALRPRGAAADATSGKKRRTQQEFI
ncbi:hypothetical protein [Glutamicibacter sp. TV12E]|uniref:hypothetical protein n=1 Tax=Glutamicibacter sp. TV12E TaxID=3446362 RepID=UPI004034F67C